MRANKNLEFAFSRESATNGHTGLKGEEKSQRAKVKAAKREKRRDAKEGRKRSDYKAEFYHKVTTLGNSLRWYSKKSFLSNFYIKIVIFCSALDFLVPQKAT